MNLFFLVRALVLMAAVFGSLALQAASNEARTRQALTVLKAECVVCHGDEKKKGGLSLSSREAVLRGGEDGPVVIPGRPADSKLMTYLQVGADPHMPPKKQLEPTQIRALRDWIKAGAAWDAAVFLEEAPLVPVELAPLPLGYQPVLALALAPDAKRLAVGRGGEVAVYDLSTTNYALVAQMPAHTDAVQSLAWSHDGRWLVSGGFRRIKFWQADPFQAVREVTNGLFGRVTTLEFSPDDSVLALADGGNGRPGFIRLISASSGVGIASWRAHADTIFDLEFSRDGARLLSAGGDYLLKVWEVASRKAVATLEGHTAQVLAAAFNTNATRVVSAGADRQLKVWDVATQEKIISLGSHTAALTSVAWPGDGATIYTVTDGGGIYRYQNLKSHTGEQSSASGDERRFGEMSDAALCLAASADGKIVCVGGQDGSVQVWDGEGKRLVTLGATELSGVASADAVSTNRSVLAKKSTVVAPRSDATKGKLPPADFRLEDIVTLSAEPTALVLSGDAPRHGVVFTAHLTHGFEVDVTDRVKLKLSRRAPFRLDEAGTVVAERAGSGELTARLGRQETTVSVSVLGGAVLVPSPPSFVRDVLPALNRAGCSAGSCHAKPEGQNGFKLSVFSYDPKADYAEIVKDARGRRVFPAAPDESLILQKPLLRIPHEGGARFAAGSETHELLIRWLRSGLAYSLTNEPVVERLTTFPRERRYRRGATQPLLVEAHYSDGSVRDVTRLASYDSNDKELAKVDEHGRLTIGTITGQGVVVARYMGLVSDTKILVPVERELPAAQFAGLPTNNFIDGLAYAQFQRLALFPSELCTDAEFLRRAKLDAVGVLPTPDEVREFLADSAPDKRHRFITQVLDDPAYADYWANKWADLVRPNPDRVGVKSVFVLDQWLREQFRENRPYDQFVRAILLAEGSNHRDGPAVIYRDRREPAELTTMFSQLFLGTRLECAKCHHHPNEKWSQDDFYRLAAFFGPVKPKGAGLSPPISAGTETFYFASGGTVKHPVTGEVMTPRPPDGPVAPNGDQDPRRALADWLTAPENPFFARAAVNRVWANFFGRGLVQPVDDFRSSNPCVNPALLDALAADFVAHGYDLKHLMRTILESRLYQLSTIPNETNLADTRNFSRGYRRRLPAEVLAEAVNAVTGVPDTYAALSVGGRATQVWSYKVESHFLNAFGRPNSSSDCPCERDLQLSVVQSLHLMNSKQLQEKMAQSSGRIHQWAESVKSPTDITTELYLATLSRPPTDDELQRATAAFGASGATRQTATEDVFWALLNSPEFVFNH